MRIMDLSTIYMHTYIYVCVYLYIYIYIYICICIYASVCMFVYEYISIFIGIYFQKYIFTADPYIYICVYVRVCVCVCVCNWAAVFHLSMLNERLLPNYTYFKIHESAAQHNTDNQKYCHSLVKRQINYLKEKINTLNT